MAAENWKLFWFIQKSNLKTAFLSKGDALINILMMLINNFSFIFMWWVIFEDKGTINGWNFDDMALMFAVSGLSFALYAVFFRGVAELPQYIENGTLDSYIVSPRNLLFMTSTSFSTFANWGDVITALTMYFLSGYVSTGGFILFLYLSFMAFLLTYAMRLILSTFAFYTRGTESLCNNILMTFLIFSNQPATIFTGIYKIIFLTIIPAGLISLFPVSLLKNFTWFEFALFTLGTGGIFLLSLLFFNRGLRQYASGNGFGIR